MALDLAQLSVQQIRRQLLAGDRPVSAQLLNKLRRDPRRGVRQLHTQLSKRYARQREERLRLDAMLNFERILWGRGVQRIAGVDEVGMGALAGPVVAAAVIFRPNTVLAGVDDSKRLDPQRRTELAEQIRHTAAAIGIGQAEVEEIDALNIYQAGLLAMRRAVDNLPIAPEHLLVDARSLPDLCIPQNPLHKGDGIDFSIAAASIIAKTHRDSLMEALDRRHPGYGFGRNKGYATAEHQAAIAAHGPCPQHRGSYTFVHELQGDCSAQFYVLRDAIGRACRSEQFAILAARLRDEAAQLRAAEQRRLRLLLARRRRAV